MPPDVLIREAQPDDAGPMLRILQAAVDAPHDYVSAPLAALVLSDDNDEIHLRKITQNENALLLVAESLLHGELCGVLACGGHASLARQHVVRLSMVMVGPWRHQGIEDHLLEYSVNWAHRHPVIRRMETTVLTRDRDILALYRAHGFQVEGTARCAARVEYDLLDTYYLAQLVDGAVLQNLDDIKKT